MTTKEYIEVVERLTALQVVNVLLIMDVKDRLEKPINLKGLDDVAFKQNTVKKINKQVKEMLSLI